MSEAPTPSSTTFAGIPLDDNKTSQILADNKSPSTDSNSNSPQGSPSDGQTPPSPDSSGNPTPPPPDSSSSSPPPPSDSNTPSSDSPPPDSNSSPSDSGSSPSPPPSDNSNSKSSPPPSDSGSSNSPPPSDSKSSPSPPPPSDSNSSPPKGDTQSPPAPPPDSSVAKPPPNDQPSSPPSDKPSSPPKSPPKESAPPPTESKASPPAPTQPLAPSPKTPVTPNSPPHSYDSPPAPTSDSRSPPATPSVQTPPGSKESQHVPELTPPSRHSDSSSSTPPSRSSSSSTGGVAGATLAGLVIIAFVTIFFVVARKKKKRANAYPGYFGPPPNYSGSADGYYYAQHSQQHSLPNSQQHAIGIAGQSNEFYSGPSTVGNGHGSYRAPESGVIAGGLSCFSYEELMGITSGFSRQNVIGEGGFGSVYKGFLTDGRAVAVKELKAGSGQGEREFRAEVEIISRVHHRHLVSLVGYCIADSHRLLVYEFVSNNTLEHHLHGEGVPVMEWSKRMKIAVGSARGLAYLHEDCHPKIIHRDIKSANILIDDDYEAQVADFGLAKLSNDISSHVSTRVMGTFGYLAPEYAASGKLSDKSDVFSFGVVLLEIVTGRKPVDGSQPLGDESLVEWARPLLAHALETGDFSELVDPRLGNRYVEDEMLRMISAASASVRHSAPKRPRMVQVLRALDTEGDMPDLTNGVKVGQSTIFQAGQNVSDMQKFRKMAFGSEDSSEYQMQSGNFTSGEAPRRPRPGDTGAVEFSSGELETRAINPRSNRRL